jgi:hypothetical protein
MVEGLLPWMILRATDTSKTATTANTWQTDHHCLEFFARKALDLAVEVGGIAKHGPPEATEQILVGFPEFHQVFWFEERGRGKRDLGALDGNDCGEQPRVVRRRELRFYNPKRRHSTIGRRNWGFGWEPLGRSTHAAATQARLDRGSDHCNHLSLGAGAH